jgi:hypothetical protein
VKKIETFKPNSQETTQNFERGVLQKFLRITFYTYIPVKSYHFLKNHHIRCTLMPVHHFGVTTMKRLDQSSLHPLIKHSETNMSRPEPEPGPGQVLYQGAD